MADDVVAPVRRSAWWRRVSGRMDKASIAFSAEMHGLAAPGRKLDDAFFDDLTEILIAAACGWELPERLAGALRQRGRREKLDDGAAAIAALKAEILAVMNPSDRRPPLNDVPSVVLVVGVNGSGKTTTLGKLAHRLREEGRTSLIAAADTYRAAAIDQMRVWGDRAGPDVVAHQPGADPGAVVFDAIQAAQARRIDAVLVDSAGRLHTKVNLMAELGKIRRVIERLIPETPHEVLLVVDATTGMNAMRQALAFHEITKLTGLVITKLDGSARGGTLLAGEEQLRVPVKLVGLGEGLDDLNVFDPAAYLDAIFGATS